MFRTSFREFLDDESGAYTIWSLVWFSLYVAMGGLAVDMTDAYRNQTMLQATADAAALAAVMSLPDENEARSKALDYSYGNMQLATNGHVVRGSEVYLGHWNNITGTLTTNVADPDAAMVVARRADDNENPLATNFLRIIGLGRWNINVEAVAIKYIPSCIQGGLVAGNQVDIRGNNNFINKICIHGQNMEKDPGHDYAVEFQNQNYIEPGVQVSMPYGSGLTDRPNVYTKNNGLLDAEDHGDLWPADAMGSNLTNLVSGLDKPGSNMPGYITPNILTGNYNVDTSKNENFVGPYVANTIYKINCSNDNKTLTLPGGVPITKVVIVTNCNVKGAQGVHLTDAAVASTSKPNNPEQNTINFPSGAIIGAPNSYCGTGIGGVELYSLASMHIAADLTISGLRAVAAENVMITANAGALGVSIQAGDSIDITSNGSFGLCPDGTPPPGKFAFHYRLVR